MVKVRGKVIGRVEELSRFTYARLQERNKMCETMRIREGVRRKGSEWWNEEIWRVVGRKKEYFLIWRRIRSEEDMEEYKRMKRMVIRMVREAKRNRMNE